jgi:hypothetical protein
MVRLPIEWGTALSSIIALLGGAETLQTPGVVGLGVMGGIALTLAIFEHGWHRAPYAIGTPVKSFIILLFIGVGMATLGHFARSKANPIPPATPDENLKHADGDTFPALSGAARPFEFHMYGTSTGNLKERVTALADKIDQYRTAHPEPESPEAAKTQWANDRSTDFRSNILESLVNIHDEARWFHLRDEMLDTLLQTESYKEQINQSGGISDTEFQREIHGDFSLHLDDPNDGPKHLLIASPRDLDKIAQRLRAIGQQMKP